MELAFVTELGALRRAAEGPHEGPVVSDSIHVP